MYKDPLKVKVIWFTGLSGSGKTTLSKALQQKIHAMGIPCVILDGDDFRHGLCCDLGFNDLDRSENIRRAAEVAKLISKQGVLVLAAFISPFLEDRKKVRAMFEPGEFIEVFCSTSLEVCEARDVKNLYKLVQKGDLKNFTGISSRYEPPKNPEVIIDTNSISLEVAVKEVIKVVR